MISNRVTEKVFDYFYDKCDPSRNIYFYPSRDTDEICVVLYMATPNKKFTEYAMTSSSYSDKSKTYFSETSKIIKSLLEGLRDNLTFRMRGRDLEYNNVDFEQDVVLYETVKHCLSTLSEFKESLEQEDERWDNWCSYMYSSVVTHFTIPQSLSCKFNIGTVGEYDEYVKVAYYYKDKDRGDYVTDYFHVSCTVEFQNKLDDTRNEIYEKLMKELDKYTDSHFDDLSKYSHAKEMKDWLNFLMSSKGNEVRNQHIALGL